ncbi:MAG: entericidin [Pseudomonadota bacterium]
MRALTTRLIAVFVVIATAGLAGCETIKGVGRDIEKTGEVLDDAIGDGQ